MNAVFILVTLCGLALFVVADAAGSPPSLRGEAALTSTSTVSLEELHRSPTIVVEDAVIGENYPSGWWYVEATQAGTCEQDDYMGENQVVSFQGYALNMCIMQGGNRIKYQCDGDSITQEIYSDYNCTHKETTYYFQPVGCSNNVVYNCTQDEFIPIPAGESFVVQTYYASSYDTANCTGPVQFFLGQENDHCFSTTGGGSQYNDYPVLRQYTGTTTCSGDNFVTNDVVTTCTPDESNTEDGISYTHFNNTLMVGRPVHHTPVDVDSSSDDFFDDETALIGVIAGGAVFVLLCGAAVYYFVFAKSAESLLVGAAASSA